MDDDPGPITPPPHFIPGWIQLRVRLADAGGDIINTFSYSPPVPTTRYSGVQLAALAGGFAAMLLSSLQPLLGAGVKFVDVVANDLTDALGEQGTFTWPSGTVGTSTGEQLPANVALASTWRTKFRGQRYRGRSFWGGFTEAATSGDNMTSAFMVALAILISNIQNFVGPVGVPVHMIVASRIHQLITPVVQSVVTSIVDTMKKRLTTHGR